MESNDITTRESFFEPSDTLVAHLRSFDAHIGQIGEFFHKHQACIGNAGLWQPTPFR